MARRSTLEKIGISTDEGGLRPPVRRPERDRGIEHRDTRPEPVQTVVERPLEINMQTAMAMDRLKGRIKYIEEQGWQQVADVVVFLGTNYHYGYRVYALGNERRSRYFYEKC